MKLTTLIVLAAVVAMPALASRDVSEVVDTEDEPTVAIEIDHGEVVIQTWDQNRVQIEGTIDDKVSDFRVFAHSDKSVSLTISEEDRGNNPMFGSDSSDTRIVIKVPERSSLDIESLNTSIDVTGLKGTLTIESINGDIESTDIDGDIDIEVINGTVNLTDIEGAIQVESVNGGIILKNTSGGRLNVESVLGDISAESNAERISVESVQGNVDLQLGSVRSVALEGVNSTVKAIMHLQDNASLSADSVYGSIDIVLREPINVRVDVESMSGEIINGINDVPVDDGDGFVPGHSLSFTEGDASANVSIETLSGSVRLSRSP